MKITDLDDPQSATVYLLHAAVTPLDENHISFHLLYSASPDVPGRGGCEGDHFQVKKTEARTVAQHILKTLAASDDEMVSFHLTYSDEFDGSHSESGHFETLRHVAEILASGILEILAAPDSQTAWERTSEQVDEYDEALPAGPDGTANPWVN
jgi:hypothetical protein